jgi:uncharacterized phosphosugar-binding protein
VTPLDEEYLYRQAIQEECLRIVRSQRGRKPVPVDRAQLARLARAYTGGNPISDIEPISLSSEDTASEVARILKDNPQQGTRAESR